MSTSGETTTETTRPLNDSATAESNQTPVVANRKQPFGQGFLNTISTGWATRDAVAPAVNEQASYAAARRDALSALFTGKRLVLPAGEPKQRSNDTDYRFRAHTAFSHMTGWGSDSEPGAVLVLGPAGDSHTATLYFRERADRTTEEFYSDAAIGEFWIGPRPSLADVAVELGIATAPLESFSAADDDLVLDEDEELTRAVSELRLVKDAFEIAQMREAVRVTGEGFSDVIRDMPRAISHRRGERVIEGTFHHRAITDGNGEGYDTIAASGSHACYLHWTRNDGTVVPGDLVLIDAGVEVDSLYTADITRTLPISGTFSDVQREVYEAVLEAADAAFAIVRPGITFRQVHETAMGVIAAKVAGWGMLPVTADEALSADNGGQHRRYMVHGTSHHLGIDVHDCAAARREMYYDGIVEEGMIFTIEPGLYFQDDDLTVPEQFRGIGARIEDDILVTADGAENLSAHIPRTAAGVEAWMAELNPQG